MAENSNFSNVAYDNHTYENLVQKAISLCLENQILKGTIIIISYAILSALCLPWVMLTLIHISVLYLKAYRCCYRIIGYSFTPDCWKPARTLLAYLWDFQGRFWYGYEVEGFNNIPKEGPALIVFYHGPLLVDWIYLLAKVIIQKKRTICHVGERQMFKFPGFDAFLDCFQINPGTVDTCVDILKEGNLLAIAPGGTREAFFADETYPLIWGSRIGFAKVALKANVPVIPVFTKNIREAFFLASLGRYFFRGIYEKTRFPPLFPIFGGFPTKLKTIVGKPIEYDASITPQDMAAKVAEEMKLLIKNHQKLPGSVTWSVIERFQHLFKRKQL